MGIREPQALQGGMKSQTWAIFRYASEAGGAGGRGGQETKYWDGGRETGRGAQKGLV